MKKSFILFATTLLALAGCTRNQEIDVPDANLSLFARTESPAETKTVVESGTHVYWEPGDEIAVFMGEKSAKFTTDITAASGTATFKGTFGDSTWPEDLDLWAVYPFSEDAVFDGETITTILPSEQIAREGSFGKDMNLSIAHSNSSSLQFYNVGGGIRFSVTEEGIKKVMFEGLSGEIISGKVKIGMDENGKSVVKEVTGGSQFITLLPPAGKETFEPGTWYYIVAIPGTLEGGYKLRFYKDTDYARKVSEKKVVIKRSIFGNLEKADSGIEYEATTTHFPETEEEIVSSVELTQSIHKEVYSVLWGSEVSLNENVDVLVEEILKIDGVIFAQSNDDNSAIAVMQKDSICVNYMLKYNSPDFEVSSTPNQQALLHMQTRTIEENTYALNLKDNKKALILAPFQWDFKVNTESCWLPALSENYSDRIQYLPNEKAGILQFKQELHDRYDFVLIYTHGTTGFNTHPILAFGQVATAPTWDTFLSTSTQYSAKALKQLIKDGSISIKETGIISPPESSIEYLGISTEILDGSSFDESCVLIFACESAKMLNNKRPWLDTFTSKGALVVSGACVSMKNNVLGPTADKLIQMMTLGCSFRDAFQYVTKSSIMSHWSNALYEHSLLKDKIDFEEFDVFNNYIYKQNDLKPTKDFFLSNPFAFLNEPLVRDDSIVFSWDSFPVSFPIELSWYYSVNSSENLPESISLFYERSFDVFLDGVKIDNSYFESNDNTKQTITYDKPSVGDHSWRVITNIIEKDSGITLGSYSSEEVHFTVTEGIKYETPEAKDLGLSVKWGSFNLGASKPEMPGVFFAWGETEPYYYRLGLSPVWNEGKEAGYDWLSYKWCNGSCSSITKYNTNALTQLEMADDAAHAHLGDKWRIPTEDEWEELRTNCSFEWATLDGVNGFLVTSNKPGYTHTFIFLPANGWIEKTSWSGVGKSGVYWSSCNSTSDKEKAGGYTFESGGSDLTHVWIDRYYGIGIRPVYGDQMPPAAGDIEGTEEDPWN